MPSGILPSVSAPLCSVCFSSHEGKSADPWTSLSYRKTSDVQLSPCSHHPAMCISVRSLQAPHVLQLPTVEEASGLR